MLQTENKPSESQFQNSGLNSASKYDLIRKNFVLPENKFEGQSSYHSSYQNNNPKFGELRAAMPKKEVNTENHRFEGHSTYVEDYLKRKGEPPHKAEKIVAKNNLNVGGDTFSGESSYTGTYKNNRVISVAEKVVHPNHDILPKGGFEGYSNYHDHYLPGKEGQVRSKIKPEGQLKVGGTFQGQSSYGGDYANCGVGLRADRVPSPSNHVIPKGNFEGGSTYNSNYHEGSGERPAALRPINNLQLGNNKFEGDSTYTNNYVPGVASRSPNYKREDNIKLPSGKFDGGSSYLDEYQKRAMLERATGTPKPNHEILPKGQFEGESTYHKSYLASEQSKRGNPIRYEDHIKFGGKFQGNSSYTDDYLNRGMAPKSQNVKPGTNKFMPRGDFEGESSYHDSYLGNKGERSQQIKPESNKFMPKGGFEGESSYHDSYLGNAGERSQKIKPGSNKFMPKGEFEGESSYHDSYLGNSGEKSQQIRPVQNLHSGGHFQGCSSYQDTYKGQNQPRKCPCPTQVLKAPKYQPGEQEHLRYDPQTHNWK